MKPRSSQSERSRSPTDRTKENDINKSRKTKSLRGADASQSESDLKTVSAYNAANVEEILGHRYVESANIPHRRRLSGSVIEWDRTREVQEFQILGYSRTYVKRTDRARPNPWRRYGAVVKLHEIGGWVSKLDKQVLSRRNRKYYYVAPGTPPPIPPTRLPIVIPESKILPKTSVHVPVEGAVEEIAHAVGVQIQDAMQESLRNATKQGDDMIKSDVMTAVKEAARSPEPDSDDSFEQYKMSSLPAATVIKPSTSDVAHNSQSTSMARQSNRRLNKTKSLDLTRM